MSEGGSRPDFPDPAGAALDAPTGCLSAEDCLAFLAGCAEAAIAASAHRHLDGCDACRMLMAEAVRGLVQAPAGARQPTDCALVEGEQVGGRYRIVRFIARGGMGEVYEAFDTALDERVALKTLPITASDRGDAAESLLREVRTARKVTHPNVCRILELGIHRSATGGAAAVPFLTMEFLVGETLAQRLRRTGPLEERDAHRTALQLAQGLSAVHASGIVHRDFKSDNVFLVCEADGHDRAVVMDFGLARVLEGKSAHGSSQGGRLIGTPAYMAPEQLTGGPVTAATDVYALGMVTFEMLTGRMPFSGDSLTAVALSRLHQAAPPPSSLVPGLPGGWDDWMDGCLARLPERRLKTMADVAAALNRIRAAHHHKSHRRWGLQLAAALVTIGAVASLAAVVHGLKPAGTAGKVTSAALPKLSAAPSAARSPVGIGGSVVTVDGDGLPAVNRALPGGTPSPARSPARRRVVPIRQRHPEWARETTGPASGNLPPVSEREEVVEANPFVPPRPSRPRHPDDLVDPFASPRPSPSPPSPSP